MKQLINTKFILTLAFVFTLTNVFAQIPKNPQIRLASKDKEIFDLEVKRLDAFARADSNAFKTMVTEDLVIIHSSGSMLNRAQEIAVMRPSTAERPLPTLSIEDAQVKLYGSAAVMRGNLVETSSDGRKDVLRFTNTYIKQKGQWRLAASQLNKIVRPAAEKHFTKAEFQSLKWLEGSWKGMAGNELFYETWRMVNDTVLVNLAITIKDNDTTIKESGALILNSGLILLVDGKNRWTATRLMANELVLKNELLPYSNVITWLHTNEDHWFTILENPKSTVYYDMIKDAVLDRKINEWISRQKNIK